MELAHSYLQLTLKNQDHLSKSMLLSFLSLVRGHGGIPPPIGDSALHFPPAEEQTDGGNRPIAVFF